jgi:nicotinate-nucleotide--dimethylbenzimidazole phosphoribosyltransferase
MSLRPGTRVLVLGGIRSGKSRVAESLVQDAHAGPDAAVRYIATAAERSDDLAWATRLATHRERRPSGWVTEEVGDNPKRLAALLTEAEPTDVLLVDDLGGWLTATFETEGAWAETAAGNGSAGGASANDLPAIIEATDALAAAVAACPAALLVLVSPEVGLSLIPATPVGRSFADAHGTLNQRVAAASDAVALVVAGRVSWLVQPLTDESQPTRPADEGQAAGREVAQPTVINLTTTAIPVTAPADFVPADGAPIVGMTSFDDGAYLQSTGDESPLPQVGLDLPLPDDAMAADATDRMATLRFDGAGLGALAAVVRFAAATQGRPDPQPWQQTRVVLLRGDHAGGCAAGDPVEAAEERLRLIQEGSGALPLLAAQAGASITAVTCPMAAPIEDRDALDDAAVDAAIRYGQGLADAAADDGVDLLVLASCGSGSQAAAVAVAALLTGGEPAALLARTVTADGMVHDEAWMQRCGTIRDALHRVRAKARDPRGVLLTLGGGDIAVATGLLLGAAARRTPVLLDGPVGVAAALLARDYGAQTRQWLLLPDTGGDPMARLVTDVLQLPPILDLKLGLGEGAAALAILPLLRAALMLASSIPRTIAAEPEIAEPEIPDPDVADPEVADPEVADPEVADAEIADPEVADPDDGGHEAVPAGA